MPHLTEKYFDAFIYSQFWFDETGTYLFYIKESDNQKKLWMLNTNLSLELSQGTQVSSLDFNKQCLRPEFFDIPSQIFWFLSDTDNKEDMNLFKLDIQTQKVEKITNCNYVTYVRHSRQGKLVYVDRHGRQDGMYLNTLCYHKSLQEPARQIFTDCDSSYRFGWGRPLFSEDETSIIVSLDLENKRTHYNLFKIDLETGHTEKLLPKNLESSVIAISDDFSKDSFLYVSEITGFENTYAYHFESRESIPLTHFKSKNNGGTLIGPKNNKTLIYAIPRLDKNLTELHFFHLDETCTKVISTYQHNLEGSVHLGFQGDSLLWTSQSNFSEPKCLRAYSFDKSGLVLKKEVRTYDGVKEQLVHGDYKYLSYRSFDGLEIPAFLLLPKTELKGVAITAFYGGYNIYDTQAQIFAEMGIALFSPGVRGSWGFGKTWEDHLKGDLGGNEILDIIWAARFLEKELNLKPSQIGVEGGSHGGYSTLRALTMPKNFNNQDSQYPFGFGICWAGFADLVDFYHTSNIPDWLVALLGPYEENKEKYMDRSPIHHFENLQTPLFVLHGTNDVRVSPSSMEGFLNKLRASDKKHFIHMIEGQGHTEGSKKEKVHQYQNMFEFLEIFK